jgi:hypothetical protein
MIGAMSWGHELGHELGHQLSHQGAKRPRCPCAVGRRDGSDAAQQRDVATGHETGTLHGLT